MKANKNQQQLLRQTDQPGTDHSATVWILRCRHCGNIYGSNSTDAWERKCPACQKGKPGIQIPLERDGEKWNREELIIAFNLYSQIPFGTIHTRNPKIIELAVLLGRSVGSVSYKLANLARLDPALRARGIRGMPKGAKAEEEVWREFARDPEGLAYESARLLAERQHTVIEDVAEIDDRNLPPAGVERETLVRLRVNQSFFRRRILSAYNYRCFVTGLAVAPLLVASHIVPWSEDPSNRLNPRNGLCLNALHDRAFDRGLMWIDDRFIVRFSRIILAEKQSLNPAIIWMVASEGKPLLLANNFSPDPALLRRHARRYRA